MAYQVIWDGKGVHISFKGHFTVEDYIQANSEIYSDSRIDNIKYIIKDMAEIEVFDVDTQDGLFLPVALDKGASRYLQRLKVALVATSTETRQIWQDYIKWSYRLRSRWTFQLFFELENAKRWLEEGDE